MAYSYKDVSRAVLGQVSVAGLDWLKGWLVVLGFVQVGKERGEYKKAGGEYKHRLITGISTNL